MQERSHAFAMKSQIWLFDPRPNLPSIVRAVEKGFELSEASNTPVMLELRIRACHVYGTFTADNVRPAFTLRNALEAGARNQSHRAAAGGAMRRRGENREALAGRGSLRPERKLNEFFDGDAADIGIVMQGGMYNTALRALECSTSPTSSATAGSALCPQRHYPLIDAELCASAPARGRS
jgi:indolepyruvate ferredoxin oxidoreductase alpha subunit